jgi:holin-like protein
VAKQLNGLIIIFAALYGGVSLQAIWLHSIPGPVLGMALLLAYLLWHGGEPYGLNAAAQWFISTLSLLFIPAAALAAWAVIGRKSLWQKKKRSVR